MTACLERLGQSWPEHGRVVAARLQLRDGGRLGIALEVNGPFRVRRAIDAMRCLELSRAADFLQDVLSRSLAGECPDSFPSDNDFYNLVDDGTGPVGRAFKAKAAETPTDFGRA